VTVVSKGYFQHNEVIMMKSFSIEYNEKEYRCLATIGAYESGTSLIVAVTQGDYEIGSVVMYLDVTNPINLVLASKPEQELLDKGMELFMSGGYLKELIENEGKTLRTPIQ